MHSEDEKESEKNSEKEDSDNDYLDEVDVLYAGEAFGEISLLHGHPRSASMKCKTECWIGILAKNDYYDILGKYEY